MTMGGPNPGLWGDSVRRALNQNDGDGARAHEASAEQSRLDDAELREFERSGVYGEIPQARETSNARQSSRLRSIVDRILRRSA